MDKGEIKAVEMVRAIRDQMYEETKGMSHEEFLAYLRCKAARVYDEAAAKRDAGSRPAA